MGQLEGWQLKGYNYVLLNKEEYRTPLTGHERYWIDKQVLYSDPVIFSYAQRRKQAVFYLYDKIWLLVWTSVCALGPCLLLLQSA